MDAEGKLRFPCLVLDHDDTTVNSTATVHYPSFVAYMEKKYPGKPIMTLEEYFRYNFDPGVVKMFTEICGMTWEEMLEEEEFWKEYVKQYVPKAYPAYFGRYKDFPIVREYLDTIENLYCIGRNGQHRYNNTDHSMLTAIEAVKAIKDKNYAKHNIWNVNTEKEYHEN